MTHETALWSRTNLTTALCRNQLTIILTSIISALLALFGLQYMTLERIYFSPRFDPWLLAEKLGNVSILLWGSLAVVLLFLTYFPFIAAHYENRFGTRLSLINPQLYRYLWKYSKRGLFFYACVGVPFLIVMVLYMIQLAVVLAKIILSMTMWIKIFWLCMVALLVLGTAVFLFRVYVFSNVIYSPLMGNSEEKSYVILWKRTGKIIMPLVRETILLSIPLALIPVLVSFGNSQIIATAHQYKVLVMNSDYVHFLCLFLTIYANIMVGFVISTVISQFYLESIGEKK